MTEEKKQNTFEQMENEKKELPAIEEEEKTVSVKQEQEIEVGVDDILGGTNYINTPDVGDSITFTVEKIVNNPVVEGTNKTTGEKFHIGVKKRDGTVIRHDIVTEDGSRFTLNAWGLVYLFTGKDSEFAAKAKELGTFKGITVKLTRNYDGSVPNKKPKEVMKLYDLKSEEEAKQYQEEVAEAIKEGKLFTLELLE